jgi:hypothetical protein
MTLLGKIFTVLILLMSLVFCTLAVATFATHRNWRLLATNPSPAPGEKKGLKEQYEDQVALNQQYQALIEELKLELSVEQAARRSALSSLQGRERLLVADLEAQAQELTDKTSALTAQTQAAVNAEQTLADITAEVKKLREEIRLAQLDRDQQFSRTVDLTDKLNAAEALRLTLEEKNRQLQDQYARLQNVAEAMGFNERTLVEHIPPPVDGRVLEVRETSGLVEISLGSDDGLKKGHSLEVYRGTKYLGRIIIREIDPDRAVGQIDKKMQRDRIQKGDNVTTKLS